MIIAREVLGMDDKVKRACVYTRVSTEGQAESGYSIEEQEVRCKAAIQSKGWECVGVYSDPGISGRTLERPGLKAMQSAIEAGKVDVVVVYKLDRLSRKQRDTMAIIEDYFMAHGVDLVSLNETLDTTTPWGRAMIGILSSFNQMECETITVRTAMGRQAKAMSGGYAGGRPPFGYMSVNNELVIDPPRAEIVRKIFEWFDDYGMTRVGIAARLNEMGYRTRSGGEFAHTTVRHILNNREVYMGIHRYGDTFGHHEAILSEGGEESED